MSSPHEHHEPGISHSARFAYDCAHALFRFFAAGAVLYELHELVLKYYSWEWSAIKMTGGGYACRAANQFANGAYWSVGKTTCRSLLTYMPWLQLYQEHAAPIAAFYGVIFLVLLGVALLWKRKMRRRFRFNRTDVETQNVHGDARLATEAEAVAAADGGAGRRSSVHHQDF